MIGLCNPSAARLVRTVHTRTRGLPLPCAKRVAVGRVRRYEAHPCSRSRPLAYLRGGGVASLAPTAVANDPYDALTRYFLGEINQEQLEAALPDEDGDPGTPAVTGATIPLVSNTGQTAAGLTTNAWTDRDYVQEFTPTVLTAPSVWEVTSVDVELTFNVQSPATLPTIRVQIYRSSNGRPTGSALGTLTLPTGETLAAGSNTFTSSPIRLTPGPSTSYVVLVDVTATSSNAGSDVRVTYTSSNDEDPGGVTGWSIGGTAFNRGSGDTSLAFTGVNNSQPIKIAISGNELTPAVPPSPPPPAFSQAHHELGDNYVGGETCGGKPNPQQEAFRQNPKAAFASGGPYQTVYCNTATGQWVTGRIAKAGVDYARDDQLEPPSEANGCLYDKPSYQAQTDSDGNLVKNADGTYVYKRFIGAYWDPIAEVCRGGPVEG